MSRDLMGTSRESLLSAIVDSAIHYAIISMDRKGFVTTWNEGARLILGWREEEMAGNPADVSFTRKTDRTAFHSGKWRPRLPMGEVTTSDGIFARTEPVSGLQAR